MPEIAESSLIDAVLPEPVRHALSHYSADPNNADLIFRVACIEADDPLPLYRTLYKFYNRQRRFDMARDYAVQALAEASHQASLAADYRTWTQDQLNRVEPLIASQALLALKALVFIHLRQDDEPAARAYLGVLKRLDPQDGSGVSVVEALVSSMNVD